MSYLKTFIRFIKIDVNVTLTQKFNRIIKGTENLNEFLTTQKEINPFRLKTNMSSGSDQLVMRTNYFALQ